VKKPYSKKLRLPLLFVDGKWELEFGGQVPVPHGTTAEILVDVSKITDRAFSEKMLARSAIPIFSPGESLRAYLAIKDGATLSDEQRNLLIPFDRVKNEIAIGFMDNWNTGEISFIEVQLGPPTERQAESPEFSNGGLWLITEGFSPSDLRSSTIELPTCVSDERAISLNHAFTLLSEVYEPWRKSHTGNAYQRFLYKEKDGNWYPLELLRDAKLAEKEQQIAADLWQEFMRRMSSPTGKAGQ
jgi:hypothetical protein